MRGRQPGQHTTPTFTRERARRPPTPALLPWDEQRKRTSRLLLLDWSSSDMRPRQCPLAAELDESQQWRSGPTEPWPAVELRQVQERDHAGGRLPRGTKSRRAARACCSSMRERHGRFARCVLATGGEGSTGVCIEKGAWTCRGASFSAKSTAARFTMGLRGCHLQSS
jgi:hypothetical protein